MAPGSDGNDGVLCILQSSSITGDLSSDCLVPYTGHSLGEPYFSAVMQLVYSIALGDWAKFDLVSHAAFAEGLYIYLVTPTFSQKMLPPQIRKQHPWERMWFIRPTSPLQALSYVTSKRIVFSVDINSHTPTIDLQALPQNWHELSVGCGGSTCVEVSRRLIAVIKSQIMSKPYGQTDHHCICYKHVKAEKCPRQVKFCFQSTYFQDGVFDSLYFECFTTIVMLYSHIHIQIYAET